eukprot:g12241.t1
MLSEAVAEALACVRKESEAYAQDGNVHYKLEEASDTAKLLEALRHGAKISGEGLPSSPKVTEFMGTQWLAACGELDPEATGVVPEAQLPALWGKVKAGFAEHIERALKQLKDFGVEVPESEHRPQESGHGLVQLGSQRHQAQNVSYLVPLLEVDHGVPSSAEHLVALEDGTAVLGLLPNGTVLVHQLEPPFVFELRLPGATGARWSGLCSPGGRDLLLVGKTHKDRDFAIWRTESHALASKCQPLDAATG